MGDATAQQSLAAGAAALAAGRWEDARTAFERAVVARETGGVHFGLAAALWWLGGNHGICSVSGGTTARPPTAPTAVSPDDVPVRPVQPGAPFKWGICPMLRRPHCCTIGS